ncbi:hypothetical protein H6P81_004618 [Aristolochia fimbriata]|uniref:Auxin-responsive protein n=1 Tax=Aristolochia fimbriata TaxID=158543 RepID=A0AAV7ET43_ARIFI|nr:hypothetical protein H6P81_004618 [Aristolochia fimbriata]
MATMLGAERDEYSTLKFEETELRLGLPGGGGGGGGVEGETVVKNTGNKRGFAETVDLELNLPTGPSSKDVVVGPESGEKMMMKSSSPKEKNLLPSNNDPAKPPASKAQVVGWPPVRSFRKNILVKNSSEEGEKAINSGGGAAFVKVSMDGAPYLRKVDLKMYKTYQDLSNALEKMFSSFTMGSQGMNGRDFMNESKLKDLLNGSDYVPTYEDKDGDWMLVGDVPWDMFVESCKRLRIMKGSEAIGLAPRAVEKCKSRS